MSENLNNLTLLACRASIEAGEGIMQVYSRPIEVEYKEDNSPLTEADKSSNKIIMNYLAETGIPVLSEEGKALSYEERKDWDEFWLVDPLDGTKEFIKRNGEFTVNIALVRNGKPVMGVIYVPVTDILYVGMGPGKAYKFEQAALKPEVFEDISLFKNVGALLPIEGASRNYTVVASRSHLSSETESFIKALEAEHGNVDLISSGSSLKICLVAEGKADVYPRLAPTMEWDTGAGHAIAESAGKNVFIYNEETELSYNKPDLLNPWFIVR